MIKAARALDLFSREKLEIESLWFLRTQLSGFILSGPFNL